MLKIHYGNRIDRLADQLIESLAVQCEQPLITRQVIVPHPEMGRWLARRMAADRRICANISFQLPTSALWRLASAGQAGFPADNPLAPDVLALRLLSLLLDDPPVAVRGYLKRLDERGVYHFAARLAALYDQYLVYRPEWVLAWERGDIRHWQGELWRRLVNAEEPHWARLLVSAFKGDPPIGKEPVRVFASSGLAPNFVRLLGRLAETRPVDIFLWSPCRVYWGDVTTGRDRQPSQELTDDPLLGSLGSQLRDYFELLQEMEAETCEDYLEEQPGHLLAGIRQNLLDLDPQPLPAGDDALLMVHGCHTRRREVEVCQDQLLALFASRPGLRPDQIRIVAPDIDVYAPIIQAVFGHPETGLRIPYRILGHRSALPPVADVVMTLLGLLSGPIQLAALIDLLRHPVLSPVFGMDAGDPTLVQEWLRGAAPLDPDETMPSGKYSWDRACQRLLMGSLYDDEQSFAGVRRAGVVAGGDTAVLDGLFGLLSALDQHRLQAANSRSLADWMAWIGQLPDRFLRRDADTINDRQVLDQALARLRRRALLAGATDPVGLPLVVELVLEELLELTSGSRGEAGGMTFASARSLRLLPAEITYVLGLNDGEFPASKLASDLDLIAKSPQRGDRSRRDDDRQMMLEWLGVSRRGLLMSYLSHNPRDNSERQPSTLVHELDESLKRWQRASGLAGIQHPPQPFSPRYGSEENLPTYQQRFATGEGSDPFLVVQTAGETEMDETPVRLAELQRFYAHPLKYYLSRQLGMTMDGEAEPLPEGPPLDLGGLEAYQLRLELLAEPGRIDPGTFDLDDRLSVDVSLPDNPVGMVAAGRISQEAGVLCRMRDSVTNGHPAEVLAFDLSDQGLAISGELPAIYPVGRVAIRPAKEKPKWLLSEWLAHLILNLLRPRPGVTHLLSLDGHKKFSPVEDPGRHLGELLEDFRQGRSKPLWLYPKASHAYALKLRKADQAAALHEAHKALLGDHYPDCDDSWVALAIRDADSLGPVFCQTAERIWNPLLDSLEEA